MVVGKYHVFNSHGKNVEYMHLAPSRAEVENGKTRRWVGSPGHGGLARSLQVLGHLLKQRAECWHAIFGCP